MLHSADFKDNTFFTTPGNNPRDSISVEIGDSKQPDTFHPQAKIMRWDNEVNFSARLVHNEQAELTTDKHGAIKWKGQKRDVLFYDLEDGYEIEVILKEKPQTNKVEFTLQTKGLVFYYQPELTQAEKDKGRERPDNVIGSYAVFASESKINTTTGKLYRAGKVGHIYRPRIEDAKGNWTWGDLRIADDMLTVTIPQTFIDSAVYPIRHAAGLTFGYTTIGGSDDGLSANYLLGQIGVVTTAGNIDSVSACISASTSRNIKGVCLLASTRAILTNGVTGAKATGVVTKQWITATYSTKPIVTATNYYACVIPNGALTNIPYDSTVSSYVWDTTNSYTTPAAPSSGDIYTDEICSIYATYTARQGLLMMWC